MVPAFFLILEVSNLRCEDCAGILIPTGIVCLCNHKQYVCLKCKHFWNYNHKTPGAYKRDWDGEKTIKDMIKENRNKLSTKSYDDYINSIITAWKKNTQSNL